MLLYLNAAPTLRVRDPNDPTKLMNFAFTQQMPAWATTLPTHTPAATISASTHTSAITPSTSVATSTQHASVTTSSSTQNTTSHIVFVPNNSIALTWDSLNPTITTAAAQAAPSTKTTSADPFKCLSPIRVTLSLTDSQKMLKTLQENSSFNS